MTSRYAAPDYCSSSGTPNAYKIDVLGVSPHNQSIMGGDGLIVNQIEIKAAE